MKSGDRNAEEKANDVLSRMEEIHLDSNNNNNNNKSNSISNSNDSAGFVMNNYGYNLSKLFVLKRVCLVMVMVHTV